MGGRDVLVEMGGNSGEVVEVRLDGRAGRKG